VEELTEDDMPVQLVVIGGTAAQAFAEIERLGGVVVRGEV
jgi:hypothetical protein